MVTADTTNQRVPLMSRPVNLWQRIRARSGYLTFSMEMELDQHAPPAPRLQWAVGLVGPVTGIRVADVGCWVGTLLSLLDPCNPAELIGIDVSGPWLSIAQTRVPRASFVGVSNITDLPASFEGRFDVVFFLETLEHLPRHSEVIALRTLASLLTPNGQLVLSTPAAGLGALLDPAWYLVGHRHYRWEKLIELLSSAGLEVSRHYYSGNFWTSVDTLLLYTYRHMALCSYSPTSRIAARSSTGLYARRQPASATIWVDARLRRGDP